MTTDDLNALLAQVVRAAGGSKCKGQPGVAYKEVTWGCDDGYEVVDGAATIIPCSVCRGTGRPPLAQAVWEGMSTECTHRLCVNGRYSYGQVVDRPCPNCHGTGRVPLTIPVAWPEQWARDAVCGGVVALIARLSGSDIAEPVLESVMRGYYRAKKGDAPGALRALEAAVEKEAGK